MKRIINTFIFILCGVNLFANEVNMPPGVSFLPVYPHLEKNEDNEINNLLETKTVMLGMTTNVVIPLEIISDIDIQALVIDDQEVVIPFEIEMNKKPDKQNYYKINYSENKIDIDKDGKIDTFIYSNKYINSKIEKDNYVVIKGRNISKDGYHEKIVYITVETND